MDCNHTPKGVFLNLSRSCSHCRGPIWSCAQDQWSSSGNRQPHILLIKKCSSLGYFDFKDFRGRRGMLRSMRRECLLPYSPGACPSRACPQWVSSRLSSPRIAPQGRACGSWSGRRSHRLDELCDRRQLVLVELTPARYRIADRP